MAKTTKTLVPVLLLLLLLVSFLAIDALSYTTPIVRIRGRPRVGVSLLPPLRAKSRSSGAPAPAPATTTTTLTTTLTTTPSPVAQGAIVLMFYLLHTLVLSRGCVAFPIQLFPNKHGLFQSVGMDSLAGFMVTVAALVTRPWAARAVEIDEKEEFIEVAKEAGEAEAEGGGVGVCGGGSGSGALRSDRRRRSFLPLPWSVDRNANRTRSVVIAVVLIGAHYLSGYLSLAIEYVLYGLAAAGLPLTVAMHRSLQVLVSHLVWVAFGAKILGTRLRPFFTTPDLSTGDGGGDGGAAKGDEEEKKQSRPDRWLSMDWRRSSWVWWVVGGYYASSFVFTLADLVNQFVLPEEAFAAAESVVTLMINPENNDRLAMAVASIAPCVSAPWWEEVLYRGFMLPALALWMPARLQGWLAIPLSGLLFGLHHQALDSLLPLTALGTVWALLYRLSSNMTVTIAIHAMWNSRVFLGSALGV